MITIENNRIKLTFDIEGQTWKDLRVALVESIESIADTEDDTDQASIDAVVALNKVLKQILELGHESTVEFDFDAYGFPEFQRGALKALEKMAGNNYVRSKHTPAIMQKLLVSSFFTHKQVDVALTSGTGICPSLGSK